MADLTSLDNVAGGPLSAEQIQGVLSQIDLDILNLVREGKLSAIKYAAGGAGGQSTDRAANLRALLAARDHYQKLLWQLPGWTISQGVPCAE